MNFDEWKPFYREILKDFGFSEEEDSRAARILKEEISSWASPTLIEGLIKGKRVNIYGAGPSLESVKAFPKGTNISADGATSYLIKKGVIPDIIVTDLDGKIDDLLKANKLGSIILIHAHGDNIKFIKKYARKFENCIATTQAKPFDEVYNFGGFTDGDRAVSLAVHFRAKKIAMYGMDFHDKIGRYSFSTDNKIKRKKLVWAEKLVIYLRQKSDTKFL